MHMGEKIGKNGHLFQFTFPHGDLTLKQTTPNKEWSLWLAMQQQVPCDTLSSCHHDNIINVGWWLIIWTPPNYVFSLVFVYK